MLPNADLLAVLNELERMLALFDAILEAQSEAADLLRTIDRWEELRAAVRRWLAERGAEGSG